jgi:ABC-2 type transport system permease protein
VNPSTAALPTQTSSGRLRRLAHAVRAQTRAELTLTLRRGESVLITIIVPAALLAFFASLRFVPLPFLVPGMLALAIMSTGLVSLGIATAYERYYGVLKRLGSSPLPRGGLLLAKALSVLAVEALQTVLLLGLAVIVYGWRPAGSFGAALGVFLLGSVAFAGLGLLMAGALRAEATLAGANGLWLLLLLLSGVVLPIDHLPTLLQGPASVLPGAALSTSLRSAMSPGAAVPLGSVALLAGWAVVILVAAVRTFQWE